MPLSGEQGSNFQTKEKKLSNVNMHSGTMRSDEFMENPTRGANPRFPTFHQQQNLITSELDPNSISFRKKNPELSQGFPSNPKYASSEFFNFYGVLNFKVKKFNKGLLKEAFDHIFERACDAESRHRMLAFGTLVKKDNTLLQLNRLATEVNRRYNIKNQNLFRMSKGVTNKAKACLRMLRLFRKGGFRNMPSHNKSSPRGYMGSFSFFYF
jgi:hypothetical protein